MAGKDSNNNRITTADRLARIETKLDTLIGQVQGISDAQDKNREEFLTLKGEVKRLEDRQSVLALGQGALSAVLSFIAGYLGMRR